MKQRESGRQSSLSLSKLHLIYILFDNMNTLQTEWEIGLSAWIIQDGNYDDFAAGQMAEFALEFYSPKYQKSKSRVKSCKQLGAAKYSVIGDSPRNCGLF